MEGERGVREGEKGGGGREREKRIPLFPFNILVF